MFFLHSFYFGLVLKYYEWISYKGAHIEQHLENYVPEP